ncbi:MAG: UvrD-helicase domain-containing protein [Chloroherpetonaceae bacterium]|nr:UvrD-helicase domain-containing protein [Chloroherpetonaceae bacterium]
MVFSEYQQRIFEAVKSSEGNILVDAVAGSGKTTTIIEALKYVPSSAQVLVCAFNKRIQEELQKRTNLQNVKIQTLHSAGYSTFPQSIRKKQLKQNKYKIIAYDMFSHVIELTEKDKESIDELAALFELWLLQGQIDVTSEFLSEFSDVPNLSVAGRVFDANEVQVFFKKLVERAVEDKYISFIDMIWFPVQLDFKTPKYDYIFVDEAQDLSPLSMQLIERFAHDSTRFVFVGDSRQAIYGFAGADINSIDNIRQKFFPAELDLPVNYRCGKSHIELARTINPKIVPHENAETGAVHFVPYPEFLSRDIDSAMIICRTNAPLVNIAFSLIKKGKNAKYAGEDVLNKILSVFYRFKFAPFHNLSELIINYFDEKISNTRNDMKKTYFSDLKEVCLMFVENAPCDTVKDLIKFIYKFFEEKQSASIYLSSIHRAKGLEHENVYFIFPELIPHPKAKGVALMQEQNLLYIAYTRAKKNLYIVTKV